MSLAQCLAGRLRHCPAAAELSSRQQLPSQLRARCAPRQRRHQHVSTSAQRFDFSLPDTGLYMPPEPTSRIQETDAEFGLTTKQMAALGMGSQHRSLIGHEPEPVRQISGHVSTKTCIQSCHRMLIRIRSISAGSHFASQLPAVHNHVLNAFMMRCRRASRRRRSTAATTRSARRRAW